MALSVFALFLHAILLRSSFAASSPNILFIVSDDLGWTDVSHNNAEYATPHIDALYSSGIELTNYYVHCTCSPTRASIMTGKYAWKTGLENINTIPPGTAQHIPFDTPTMAEVLRDAGYTTHGLGKWHLGYAAWNMTPTGRGFDTYFGMFQGEQFYYNHTFQAPPPFDVAWNGFDFWDNTNIFYDAIGNYSNTLYEQRVVQILNEEKQSAKPFFIYLSFQTVHSPIEQPPKQYKTCDGISNPMRQIYCNKVVFMDESIGNIIQTLKENELYSNTLIAFTTDNGGMPYWLNENTPYAMALSWGCNYPLRAGKATFFEGGVKGIGVLSGALIENKGLQNTTNDIMAHCSDWFATFLEGIAGKELPKNIDFDSLNMWNGLGRNATNWNRSTLYLNIDTVTLQNEAGALYAIIDNESETNTVWKYIEGQQAYTNSYFCNQTAYGPTNLTQMYWLFNLSGDPLETTDLMHVYPEKANQLRNMIEHQIQSGAFVADQDDTFYNLALPALHNGVWAPFLK